MESSPSLSGEKMVVIGLEEEEDYVHVNSVDCLEMMEKPDMTDELQLMTNQDHFSISPPPASTSENFTFMDSASTKNNEIALTMGSPELHIHSDWGTMEQRPLPGKTASFLGSKGFGWLLEVEDQEENIKPLL